jgi:hypothetical protein
MVVRLDPFQNIINVAWGPGDPLPFSWSIHTAEYYQFGGVPDPGNPVGRFRASILGETDPDDPPPGEGPAFLESVSESSDGPDTGQWLFGEQDVSLLEIDFPGVDITMDTQLDGGDMRLRLLITSTAPIKQGLFGVTLAISGYGSFSTRDPECNLGGSDPNQNLFGAFGDTTFWLGGFARLDPDVEYACTLTRNLS